MTLFENELFVVTSLKITHSIRMGCHPKFILIHLQTMIHQSKQLTHKENEDKHKDTQWETAM